MAAALTWCENILVGYTGDPHLFFGRSLPFLIISIITKNKTILCVGSCNYCAFTVHMELNCYINTGVRDLEVALFKANST